MAAKDSTGTYYYHGDHLGSTSVVTDASGVKAQELYYFPYGGTRVNSGNVNARHKFTGQEEDGETGLYYYGARYYDPQLGRFISPDSIVADPSNPQDLNRYSYVDNNPLNYTDPTGHFTWKHPFRHPFSGAGRFVFGATVTVAGTVATLAGCPVGPAIMGAGMGMMGAEVNGTTQGHVASWGGSGSSSHSGGDSWYGGHGYGGNGNGYGNSGYGDSGYGGSEYNGDVHGNTYDYTSTYRKIGYTYGRDLEFVEAYGHRDSYESPHYRRDIDWFAAGLTIAGSAASLASIAVPPLRYVGMGITFTGIIYAGYQYKVGAMTESDFRDKVVLDVSLQVAGPFGKWVGGEAADAAVKVFKHEYGLFKTGKKIFYDPNAQ